MPADGPGLRPESTGTLVTGRYLYPGVGEPGEPPPAPLVDGAAYVEGDRIVAVGPTRELRSRYPGARELGGSGHVVMPGLVDAHQHGRGPSYIQCGVPDGRLELWLQELKTGTTQDRYACTVWSALQALSAGVTTVMYSHFTFNMARYEPEFTEAVQAYRDSGIRATFAVDVRDRGFFTYDDDAEFLAGLPPDLSARTAEQFAVRRTPPPDEAAGLARAAQQAAGDGRLAFCMGSTAPQWCTPDTLVRLRQAADDLGCGIHLHCLETRVQKAWFQKTHGKSPVALLDELGVLRDDVSLAHCVWLTPDDIELMAARGAMVSHNASANLRLHSGIAPVPGLRALGVTFGLGTDSCSLNDDGDLFCEMRLASRLDTLPGRDEPPADADVWLRAATVNGARAALRREPLGRIRPGYQADLVLLDREALERPYSDDLPDILPSLLFYRARGAHVRTVMVGGKVAVQDGRFVACDPGALVERMTAQAVSGQEGRRRRQAAVAALRPYFQDFVNRMDRQAEADRGGFLR